MLVRGLQDAVAQIKSIMHLKLSRWYVKSTKGSSTAQLCKTESSMLYTGDGFILFRVFDLFVFSGGQVPTFYAHVRNKSKRRLISVSLQIRFKSARFRHPLLRLTRPPRPQIRTTSFLHILFISCKKKLFEVRTCNLFTYTYLCMPDVYSFAPPVAFPTFLAHTYN